ncbi:MAG: regulatory protein RecX [Bacteriovoracia bacterium]
MKSTAYQYALYLLSAQDYSEFKLRQKLRLKQFEAAEIDETLQKLIEKNYLREEEYKRLLARRWIAKGYSDSMIKRRGEQEQLTFTSDELLALRSDMDRSAEDTIGLLVQKKMRGREIPTDREAKQKLREKVSRFLISKGYGWDEVKKAVDMAMKPN